jgi:hypothetical protein
VASYPSKNEEDGDKPTSIELDGMMIECDGDAPLLNDDYGLNEGETILVRDNSSSDEEQD